MRCLQCGKAIPLFKRLGGSSEFCSEAHRREYQQEYSQLALGRLLQSQPSESQAPPLAGASAPAIVEPPAAAVNGAPAWAQNAHSAATPLPGASSNGIAKSEPPLPNATTTTEAESHPAPAQPAIVQKPAPAEWRFALAAARKFEHVLASLAPDRPSRQLDMLHAELAPGRAVPLERHVGIADSLIRPMESKLDLREVSRPTPKIAMDLRIVPPESLQTESRPLAIAVTPTLPAEASLWINPYCDFEGELASLGDFANAQFAKSGFEAPVLTGGSAVVAAPEPSLSESQQPPEETNASLAESQTSAPAAAVRVPDPELKPLPVRSTGIAPGRAKPLPVFGPVPISAGTVQVPQPKGLPLRPVMVLATPGSTSPVHAGVKDLKADNLSPRSASSIKPELPESQTSTPLSSAPDLGLPELRKETPPGPMASKVRKIIAALTGAAVLGGGLFFFLDQRSDAGSKSPTPVLADGAQGGEWIANFSPDVRRQRRVSLLRSSINLRSYRLDFESSIRIKALGWVYRAHDPENFYVSKIEFQKPGVNPVYALVHYAVINGVEQSRVETPLHVSVPMGGFYKIRFEAVGNRFTTWVQGQQVEQWTDPRLSSGGAGLFGEGVEQSILNGDFVVTPLSN